MQADGLNFVNLKRAISGRQQTKAATTIAYSSGNNTPQQMCQMAYVNANKLQEAKQYSQGVEANIKLSHHKPQDMLLELLQLAAGNHDDAASSADSSKVLAQQNIATQQQSGDDVLEISKPQRLTAERRLAAGDVKTTTSQTIMLTKSALCVASTASDSEQQAATGKKPKQAKPVQNDFALWKSFHEYSVIPSEILDDLVCRFIINCPNIYDDLIRLCFEIELAHWFYTDFYCSNDSTAVDKQLSKRARPCGIRYFALAIFEHVSALHRYLPIFNQIFDEWLQYKRTVPTFGAILISDNLRYCLLVQSYMSNGTWGFPKGKVNECETPMNCAVREVYEETGFDIKQLITPAEYIDAVVKNQYVRLYIVWNVPLATQFTPRTRQEIKSVQWFEIDALPVVPNDANTKQRIGMRPAAFYLVLPFMKSLKEIVKLKRLEAFHLMPPTPDYGSDSSSNNVEPNKPASTAVVEQTTTGVTETAMKLETCLIFKSNFQLYGGEYEMTSQTLPCNEQSDSSASDSSTESLVNFPLKRAKNISNLVRSADETLKLPLNESLPNEDANSIVSLTDTLPALNKITEKAASKPQFPNTSTPLKPTLPSVATPPQSTVFTCNAYGSAPVNITARGYHQISPQHTSLLPSPTITLHPAALFVNLEAPVKTTPLKATPSACSLAPSEKPHKWQKFNFDLSSILSDLP